MKKLVKTFDRFDLQYTPEDFLNQIDAHMILKKGEQFLDPVAYSQWHKLKMAFIQCSLSEKALGWFLRLDESCKIDCSAPVSPIKKHFF